MASNIIEGIVIDIFYHGAVIMVKSEEQKILDSDSEEIKIIKEKDNRNGIQFLTFSDYNNVFKLIDNKEIKAGNILDIEDGTQINVGENENNTTNPYNYNILNTNPKQTRIENWGLNLSKNRCTELMELVTIEVKNKITDNNIVSNYYIKYKNEKDTNETKTKLIYLQPKNSTLFVQTSDNLVFMMNKENNELYCLLAMDPNNLWRVYGGHVDEGENINKTATRELQEEANYVFGKEGQIKKFSVNRELPSEVQESRRGLSLKQVYVTTEKRFLINLFGYLNEFYDKNDNILRILNEINPNEYAYNHFNVEDDIVKSSYTLKLTDDVTLHFLRIGYNKIYQIIGTQYNNTPTMMCRAEYKLYKFDSKLSTKQFISGDPSEPLKGMFLDYKQVRRIIDQNLLLWNSHAVSIQEGYSYFNKFLKLDKISKDQNLIDKSISVVPKVTSKMNTISQYNNNIKNSQENKLENKLKIRTNNSPFGMRQPLNPKKIIISYSNNPN